MIDTNVLFPLTSTGGGGGGGSQVQADWNENDSEAKSYVKNRTHYTSAIDVNVNIGSLIDTGTSSLTFVPVSIPSCLTDGEYVNLEDGQVYNVLYKDVLYQNIPVTRAKLTSAGMDLPCIGNWGRLLLSSDLMSDYFENLDGPLEDNGLPFVMVEFVPGSQEQNAECGFAFLTKEVDSQSLVITDASDPSKSYSLSVPKERLYAHRPFLTAAPQAGTDILSIIQDNLSQTVKVNNTEVNGVWRIFYEDGVPFGILQPEGFDVFELFPHIADGDFSYDDQTLFDSWPCILTCHIDVSVVDFYNYASMRDENLRCLDDISLGLQVKSVVELDKKYLPKNYRDILKSDSKEFIINFGLDSDNNTFINVTPELPTETYEVVCSIQTVDERNFLSAMVVYFGTEASIMDNILGAGSVNVTFNGNTYTINVPTDGEVVTAPYIEIPLPSVTLGDLTVWAVNIRGGRGFILGIDSDLVQAGDSFIFTVTYEDPKLNVDLLPIAKEISSDDTGLVTAKQVYDYCNSLEFDISKLEPQDSTPILVGLEGVEDALASI